MANVRDLGGGDLKDTLAARDFLVATGFVDPRKVGIMGSSYGGTMTLMALGRAPAAFAAGVQWCGVFNRRTQYESANAEEKQWLVSMLGDPVKDKAAYDAASPASYVQNINAPVLSLQGENDPIVPRNQAEELDQSLRSRGIITEAIFYPGEGHRFLKIENQTDALRRTVAWFDKYLKDGRPAAERGDNSNKDQPPDPEDDHIVSGSTVGHDIAGQLPTVHDQHVGRQQARQAHQQVEHLVRRPLFLKEVADACPRLDRSGKSYHRHADFQYSGERGSA